jgi:hypothetical protein
LCVGDGKRITPGAITCAEVPVIPGQGVAVVGGFHGTVAVVATVDLGIAVVSPSRKRADWHSLRIDAVYQQARDIHVGLRMNDVELLHLRNIEGSLAAVCRNVGNIRVVVR